MTNVDIRQHAEQPAMTDRLISCQGEFTTKSAECDRQVWQKRAPEEGRPKKGATEKTEAVFFFVASVMQIYTYENQAPRLGSFTDVGTALAT